MAKLFLSLKVQNRKKKTLYEIFYKLNEFSSQFLTAWSTVKSQVAPNTKCAESIKARPQTNMASPH